MSPKGSDAGAASPVSNGNISGIPQEDIEMVDEYLKKVGGTLGMDSVPRIAAMFAARKARTLASRALRTQHKVQLSVSTQVSLDETQMEARNKYDILCREEQKEYGELARKILESHESLKERQRRYEKVMRLERDRDEKCAKIQHKLYRESFVAFMEQQRQAADKAHSSPSAGFRSPAGRRTTPQGDDMDSVTKALTKLYEPCLLPFATDPVECWERGVTVHPMAQTPIHIASPDKKSVLVIPTYHELASNLKEKYLAEREAKGGHLVTGYPQVEQRPVKRNQVDYASSPLATYARNYPYHVPPE